MGKQQQRNLPSQHCCTCRGFVPSAEEKGNRDEITRVKQPMAVWAAGMRRDHSMRDHSRGRLPTAGDGEWPLLWVTAGARLKEGSRRLMGIVMMEGSYL